MLHWGIKPETHLALCILHKKWNQCFRCLYTVHIWQLTQGICKNTDTCSISLVYFVFSVLFCGWTYHTNMHTHMHLHMHNAKCDSTLRMKALAQRLTQDSVLSLNLKHTSSALQAQCQLLPMSKDQFLGHNFPWLSSMILQKLHQ